MPTAQPSAGYASKTEAVMALTARRVPPRDIAHCLGISESTVYALRRNARDKSLRRAAGVKERKATTSCAVVLTVEAQNLLHRHAVKRNISIAELAHRLLEHIAHDNLVDSVMDDAEIRP